MKTSLEDLLLELRKVIQTCVERSHVFENASKELEKDLEITLLKVRSLRQREGIQKTSDQLAKEESEQ